MHQALAHAANIAYFGRDGAELRAAEARRVFSDARELIAWMGGLEPGPELIQTLIELPQIPLDPDLAIDAAAMWTKVRSWVEAQEMAAVARAAGAGTADSDAWIAADLAATTHESEHAVAERLQSMRRVAAGLPLCWEALDAGDIRIGHLRAVDAVTQQVSAELAQQVEAAVLPKALAREWTPSQLRDAARRELLKLDPDGARERAARAKVRRSDVKLYGDEDEMSNLVATGDAWTNRQMMDEINRRADALKAGGDRRGLGELRVAALAGALLDVPAVRGVHPTTPRCDPTTGEVLELPPEVPIRLPKRAQAHVTIDLATLIGIRDNPGQLAGHGPVTAELARRIAADASLRLLVLSPATGKPVGQGRNSYVLDAESRRWVEARDRECLFPGCRRQAIYCDADHDTEWDRGGETDCDNCGLYCRRHHNFKTSKAWDTQRHPDDTVTWTSPYGHTFTVGPEPYDVDTEPTGEAEDDVVLPDDLTQAIPADEWDRRWQSWPRAG